MTTIKHILNDFFCCTKFPIQAIDDNYKLIHKIGLDDELEYFVSNYILIEKLKSNEYSLPFSIIKFDDSINFLVTPVSKFDKNKGIFIVGPFRNSFDAYGNINYLSDECNTYIIY